MEPGIKQFGLQYIEFAHNVLTQQTGAENNLFRPMRECDKLSHRTVFHAAELTERGSGIFAGDYFFCNGLDFFGFSYDDAGDSGSTGTNLCLGGSR